MADPRPLAVLLSPVRPDAQGVGLARRAWMWAMALAAEHRLLTIVFATYAAAAEGACPVPGQLRVLQARQAGAPQDWLGVDDDLLAQLKAALPDEPPARVVVFRLYLMDLAQHLPAEWQARIELDCDDLESRTRNSLAWLALRHEQPSQAWAHIRGARAYRAAENRALQQFARVHVAAAEDADMLGRRGARMQAQAKVSVAANRIAEPLPTPMPVEAGPPRVLFVGSLGYLPNQDAALWLAKSIVPRLRRLVPGVEVAVAGAASPDLIVQLERAGLVYLGAEAGFSAAYARASLAIAPLRGGGGTKFKVLEAWLHGRPVVATSHACRGLGAISGNQLLMADSATGLAKACARLLADTRLAASLVTRARALLTDGFLLPTSGLPFNDDN